MKAYACLLSAVLFAAPGGAVLAATHKPAHHPEKAAKPASGQAWTVGRCSLSLPKGWGDDHHGGKADPKDHEFNVTIGSASSAGAMASTLKAMGGRMVADGKELAVMRVDLRRRGARQYWAVTKSTPACRATVTYDASQETAARKIADSLKRRR